MPIYSMFFIIIVFFIGTHIINQYENKYRQYINTSNRFLNILITLLYMVFSVFFNALYSALTYTSVMTAFKSMYHLTKLYDDPSLINKVLELGKKSFNNNDVSTMIIIFVIGVITSVVFVFISNSINKYYGPIINSILYVFAFLYLYNLIFYSTILILTETMILKLFIVITIIGFYGLIGNVIYNIYKVVKNNFNKKNSLIKIGQRD